MSVKTPGSGALQMAKDERAPNGPWKTEPDEVIWVTHVGLQAAIFRNPGLGFLLGYVGVPPSSNAYQVHYDDLRDVEVHGGLTFSDLSPRPCFEGLWVLGFDCGHGFDYVPSPFTSPVYGVYGGLAEYRDLAYVTAECEALAEQLVALGTRKPAPIRRPILIKDSG